MGRLGGQARAKKAPTEAQSLAARINGKKGGRPKKQPQQPTE
jgi:hypothetical protein